MFSSKLTQNGSKCTLLSNRIAVACTNFENLGASSIKPEHMSSLIHEGVGVLGGKLSFISNTACGKRRTSSAGKSLNGKFTSTSVLLQLPFVRLGISSSGNRWSSSLIMVKFVSSDRRKRVSPGIWKAVLL